MSVQPIPEGYHSVTPYLMINGAAEAIEFYRRAFGATQLFKLDAPGGKIGHAEIQLGDSRIMMADDCGGESPFRNPQIDRWFARGSALVRRRCGCRVCAGCRRGRNSDQTAARPVLR